MASKKNSEKSVGDPYDIFSQALSNTFKTYGDNATKIQDALDINTLSPKPSMSLSSTQSMIPNLSSMLTPLPAKETPKV